jgi:myo-inositol 2-dehydrogenase/D-chiro-inositol 1-dehydrogenase
MVRIGVVGVGRLGSLFARTLAAHPDVDGVVLAGSRPDSADALSEELSAVAAADPSEIFGSVDAVVIAASTAAHYVLIRQGADAGIPMFCEKPITLDLESTDEAIALVQAAEVPLQVGFQRRFDAGYRAARDMARAREFGEIYLVRTTSLDRAPSPEPFVRTSGDLFRDLLVHDFDAIRFVTGQEIEEVFAAGTAGFPAFDVYARNDDEGIAVGTLRLSGGAQASFAATRHNPDGYDIRMEIHGSSGAIAVGWDNRMPLAPISLDTPPPPGPPYRDFLDRFAPAYRAEMCAFVDLVLGRAPNLCPPQDARAAFVAALAAGRSATEGRPVPISEVDGLEDSREG